MPVFSKPSWADNSWDFATIEGKDVPALIKVEGIERGVKLDVKEAPGATGAKVTFKGFEGSTFRLKLRMWVIEQETEFNENILPLLDPHPGKEAPKGLAFAHPAAALRKIEGFLVVKLTGPDVTDDGFTEYTVECREYRKPTPQQGTPGAGGGGQACAQLKAEYDHYVNQANVLGSKGISDYDSLDAYENARIQYQLSLDKAQHLKNLMAEKGCSETPASAGAAGGAAGGFPPP